jgi:hypothetical protein
MPTEYRPCPRPSLNACRRASALIGALLLLPACVEEVSVPAKEPLPALVVDESRTVELRFLRFDVVNAPQRLTMADLAALPRPLLESTWLLDLDLRPFVENALTQFKNTRAEDVYALPKAAQNLFRLLNITPTNATLEGTRLAALLDLGAAVGFPPGGILGDLVQIDKNEEIIPTSITSESVIANVVASHPNARRRRGPVTPDNPVGIYPVTPGSIPVTLADVASNFTDLAERFGPAPIDPQTPSGPFHPGFIVASTGLADGLGEFEMVVRASLNALPFKGVDLTGASVASVSSTESQLNRMFNFSDPNWLSIRGLPEELSIKDMTLAIYEDRAFIPGGSSREPLPRGNSPAWDVAPWEFEHVIIAAAEQRARKVSAHCTSYAPLGTVESPLSVLDVCIDDTGWTEIRVDPSVVLPSPAPRPSYFWDILLEVAEARLHDGGVAEGQGHAVFTVHDVPIGVNTDALVARIRRNLEATPAALGPLARRLTENARGDADFYYYVPSANAGAEAPADYLYFITKVDIRVTSAGEPARPYAYAKPGFFADAELTNKASSKAVVEGDAEHEKVKITPGDVLYTEDDQGRRYRISVGEKPSRHRITLTITRIR